MKNIWEAVLFGWKLVWYVPVMAALLLLCVLVAIFNLSVSLGIELWQEIR